MSGYNPIKRGKIKPKAKQAKESAPWRTPKIRLDAEGMRVLRNQVFMRANFQCENFIAGVRCPTKITYYWFQLHHLQYRARGGSDSLENTVALCAPCHSAHHANTRRVEVRL